MTSTIQLPPPQNPAAVEELACVTRLPVVTLQLRGSLLKPRGYELSEREERG